MANRFIILFYMLLFALCSFGQSLKFEHYNDNDGLSHNSVRHIVQDKHGFLWLGTFSGLNRFDGYEFQTFLNTSEGDRKINDNDITALEIDKETGDIWIGTRKGLTLFTIETQEFTTFLNEDGNLSSLQDEEIRSIYIDKFSRVWVGTKDSGIFLFFAEEKRFEKVEIQGFNYVKEIFEDTKGNIWIGSYGSASVAKIILDSVGKIQQIETFVLQIPNSTERNPYVNFIYEDAKKDIFVGTRKGLYKLDKNQNKFVNLYIENNSDREALGPYFLTVTQAPNGKYWVGTLGGLLVCDSLEAISKGEYKRYFSVLTDQTSLIDNLVSALYFDTSGILWIGTEDGLDKYDPFENQFNLNKDISNFIGNQAPRIRGFSKTYDDKIIVATRHNGLFISEKENFIPLEINQKDIASICSTDGKTFYCGLWDGKILIYDYVNRRSKEIGIGFEESPVIAFENLGNGKLVIGSFGEGAVILDTEDVSEKTKKIQLLKGYEINEIIKDTDNNLWFATETGVVKHNLVNGDQMVYTSSLSKVRGLLHNNVSDIVFDNSGKLWAATRNGLCFFDEVENNFLPLKNPKELAGKWITDLLIDKEGDLWLNVNNNSVARLKTNSLDYNIYHVNSGNRLDYFSSRGFYKFGDSNIYLGGKKGVIYFSPYTIKENKLSPQPVITEVKIQNEILFPTKEINGEIPLAKDFNQTKSIALNYKNRNFSLQFSTPSYANEKLNKFEYQLEGFDQKWIATSSNSRTVQYTNLFPGNYVFKIKSCNSDGHWSNVVSYKIKIERPFWFTYQALILLILLIGVILHFVRREVKNRLRLKQELVTEKVNRERDIKLNNEKLRFFTNISHELRTPLTLILGPVKQLIEESKTYSSEYQKSRYNLIHQNASRLLNLVNQVLDFRKAQTGELKLKVSRTDILQYTHNTFDSFKEFAYNKEIQMNFNTENDSLFGWIDHDKLDKILYNLLSNAIKFTNKYGHVDLYVRFKDEKEEVVVLEVSDDGIGIPVKSQEKIFKRFYQATNSKENNTGSGIGLSLVKALVDLHKGQITVESTPKKGSVFSVEIPIKREFYSKNEVFEFVANTNEETPIPQVQVKKITTNTEIKEKILVVEDNIELRKYLIDYLSNYYKVYEAENGEEGLRICRQIKPILCVADVMMPIKSGLEFCEELKNDEFISHIPVILLTALSENEDKVKGYNIGADGYLVKPFDPSLLRSIIVNIIKSRLELKSKFSNDAESEIGLITHSPVDEVLMGKISKLIDENISKPDLTTGYICEELGVSSSKLYRKIKELTDLAPNEFIRTVRLKRSVQLLKTKKYNVSEVTDLIGFNDPLYFSRCFKKQFGYPPSKLLK
ncbi:hybrid sensor histidine kinase/response regulator transcription factor [Algibacter sp. L4_22]|uniref:hybrid sensor histidine kinase/response regulator transcription factor n=1 Tax=Algibacter sp. L4_22 TaxID=2942477 RepID=UPI00201B7623|nr:hybrid sensor histidine kinase/response regulator transcription factor [Algibacter sp. L4_22]MCL5129817.1 ATP-binding protein [Algibacter sp. L4_22]